MKLLSIDKVAPAIKDSWCPLTIKIDPSYIGKNRTSIRNWLFDEYFDPDTGIGQCLVTALVVNLLCGGKIVQQGENCHWYNQLPDGTFIDLTQDQFKSPQPFEEREHVFLSFAEAMNTTITTDIDERTVLLLYRTLKRLEE